MPPRDFALPDDFPNLSIPEETRSAPQPLQPIGEPIPTTPLPWKVGDRVLAPWEPQFLYVGRIAQIKGKQILVEFEDGDAGWVLVNQLRKLVVKRRQKVLFRRKMGPQFFPGEITDVDGDQVRVRFAEGPGEEWTRIAGLRIPCEARGPGAAPTKVASHMTFLEHLRPGDRVWAPWNSTTLYAGTVDDIRGKEVHIHFDDGDRGWVQLDQLVPLQIAPGLRVMGRWKMRGHFYPGTVTQVNGERIHIQYDDGDHEWTKAAALMIPCERFGPDARPTKSVNGRSSMAWGWAIAILIGLVLLALRGGFR
jgi:hypothetical protein